MGCVLAILYFHGNYNSPKRFIWAFKQEALKHILLIFSKLNLGIGYVRGMNEVLAPLFYVFKTNLDESNAVRK